MIPVIWNNEMLIIVRCANIPGAISISRCSSLLFKHDYDTKNYYHFH
jgi:hypothetical protein